MLHDKFYAYRRYSFTVCTCMLTLIMCIACKSCVFTCYSRPNDGNTSTMRALHEVPDAWLRSVPQLEKKKNVASYMLHVLASAQI